MQGINFNLPVQMQKTKESSGSKTRPNRLEYLDQLVVEYQTTNSRDAREQILANLANFAFDPLNYEFFRRLNILDLFLDNLSSREENLVKFSIGGLCNLCLEEAKTKIWQLIIIPDPINKQYIIKNGLKSVINLLEHLNEEVSLSAMTTLMFLITPESKEGLRYKKELNVAQQIKNCCVGQLLPLINKKSPADHGAAMLRCFEIASPEIVNVVFKYSKDKNRRLSNLAKVFIEDYCTEEQIKKASEQAELAKIPVPES